MSSADRVLNGVLLASGVGALVGTAYVLYHAYKENSECEDIVSKDTIEELKKAKSNGSPGLLKVTESKPPAHVSLDTSFRMDDYEGAEPESQIFRICVSGGPKSGGTTAISKITENLTSLGYKVFNVPSCFALTVNGGYTLFPPNQSKEDKLKTLITFMKMLMKLEDYFLDMATDEEGKNVVVLYTLGAMDVKARVEEGLWEAMLAETGWSEVTLRGR